MVQEISVTSEDTLNSIRESGFLYVFCKRQ